MAKTLTAKEKVINLLESSKGVKTEKLLKETNLVKLLQRDLASYNDRVTKAGNAGNRVSASALIKELKAEPTRENIYKILTVTGSGYTNKPPIETIKKPRKESPKQKAKRELKERLKKGFRDYVTGEGKTKYGKKEKKGYKNISEHDLNKLGRIFQELRRDNMIPSIISSDEVVEAVLTAEEKLGEKASPTKILKWIVDNTRDEETAKKVNRIFGVDLYGIEEDEEYIATEEEISALFGNL